MYNVGGALGGVVAFFIGSKLGRKRTMLTGLVITTIGAIIQCTAQNIAQLIVGRIICGIGVGIMTSTVGIWQGEVCPAKTRGRYLTFQLLLGANTGLFLAQWMNYGFSGYSTRVAFVFPLAFQLVFIILATVMLMCGLPDSPRWLYREGRHQEALEVLHRVDMSKTPAEREENVKRRFAEIQEVTILEQRGQKNQYAALFTNGPTQNFRRLVLACSTMAFHQLVGTNSITYFQPTLLTIFIGVDHATSLWITGLLSVTSIFAALVPVLTIDRFGRRPFLYGGAACQAVIFIIIAVLLGTSPPQGDHAKGVGAVVLIFLWFAVNSMTWLGPSWAYPAEILPLAIREKGLALGNVFYWAFQVMIVEVSNLNNLT